MAEIISYTPSSITTEQTRGVARLLQKVWPHAVAEISALAETFQRERPEKPDLIFYALWDDDSVVATAQTFARTIHFATQSMTVLALAGVCVHPDYRGQGIGSKVVRAAFAPVDAGRYAVSLFQTGAPHFYRCMGARLVENAFSDSTAPEPEHRPWWDPHVMIYPADFDWPNAPIDLGGAGY